MASQTISAKPENHGTCLRKSAISATGSGIAAFYSIPLADRTNIGMPDGRSGLLPVPSPLRKNVHRIPIV
jgi:hypothetical protein